jgi:diacylglycerol kinase (ATP)
MNQHQIRNAQSRLTWAGRMKSFKYAWQGIVFMLKTQHNAWLHGVASVLVLWAGFYCHLKNEDWRWVVVAMAMVWMAEAFNTAVEYVCDVISPSYSEAVKHAKDIAAGAVLICAINAVIVGILVFSAYV